MGTKGSLFRRGHGGSEAGIADIGGKIRLWRMVRDGCVPWLIGWKRTVTRSSWLRSAALVLIVIAAMLLMPGGASAATGDCELRLIGRSEPVEVGVQGNPQAVEQQARVDTGAGYSSIDDDFARSLGIDLENAETITIRSSLGEEKRPRVNVHLRVAGKTIDTEVTVTDRDERTHPMLLGRRDLAGFAVDPSREDLTRPDGSAGSSSERLCAGTVFGSTSSRSEALTLLTTIPVTAALVVGIRTLVGLVTFGVFAPILLTIAFEQIGFVRGIGMFAVILATGLLVQPLLRRLYLPRVARLAVLVALVVEVMLVLDLYLEEFIPGGPGAAAFPVVVLAIMVERFWTNWEEDSLATALKTCGWTLAVASIAYPILVAGPVQSWVDRAPWMVALLGGLLSLLFGRYRGLRLLELTRFRPAAEPRPVTTERSPS